jgi:DNA-binding transcriptional LysR family regulator
LFDWDDIRFFLALHRHRSLARAGSVLGVDATTVSRRIGDLESKLGARLFDRSARGARLSDAGTRLLARAQRMEDEALAVERDLAGDDQRLDGTVRLTATEMLSTRFIAPFLGSFNKRHPDIVLDLVCTSQDLDLSRREADIALRLSRPKQDDLVVKRLFDIELALYGSVDYLAAHGVPDLAAPSVPDHAIVLFADTPGFRRENAWIEARVRGARIATRCDSVSSIYSAAVAGVGMALLPCHVADAEPGLQRIPVEGAPAPRQVWQAVHRDLHGAARIRAVLDFLGRIFTPVALDSPR